MKIHCYKMIFENLRYTYVPWMYVPIQDGRMNEFVYFVLKQSSNFSLKSCEFFHKKNPICRYLTKCSLTKCYLPNTKCYSWQNVIIEKILPWPNVTLTKCYLTKVNMTKCYLDKMLIWQIALNKIPITDPTKSAF